MKLEDLYKLSKECVGIIGDKTTADMTIYLNEAKHENLQQEAYRLHNKTLQGYKSKNTFEVIIGNVKLIIKLKK